jgi:hypothetical protein
VAELGYGIEARDLFEKMGVHGRPTARDRSTPLSFRSKEVGAAADHHIRGVKLAGAGSAATAGELATPTMARNGSTGLAGRG